MIEMPLDYFQSHDGLKLSYVCRKSGNAQSVMIFVHGLNEYVGRYRHVLDYFSRQHTVYFYDQRGHGFSEGFPAYVEKFSHFTADLKLFIKLVHQREPDKKFFVVGHSMGGQILIDYLAQEQNTPLAGALFSSPNIRIHMRISAIKKFIGTKLAECSPKFRFPSEVNPKWLTHDVDSVRAYKSDPKIPKFITAGLALEILNHQEGIMEYAKKISLPVLMMHAGEDHISEMAATREFFENIASTCKTLKIYDGFYHELFNEVEKEKIFGDMENWLTQRC